MIPKFYYLLNYHNKRGSEMSLPMYSGNLRTTEDVVRNLSKKGTYIPRLERPEYKPPSDIASKLRVGLAVESMKRHMTDEGWQIFAGLGHNRYILQGRNLPYGRLHIPQILLDLDPGIIVMQDKREWDVRKGDFRDPLARFTGVETLKDISSIFKGTILKDAQQRPNYHRDSADEIGCHFWIIYYHPRIVSTLAPYVRPEHLVRTYHSLDSMIVPLYSFLQRKDKGLLSGAISGAYPMRQNLVANLRYTPNIEYLKHPGYHRNVCETPEFIRKLTSYKVAICTSSVYGYTLRKIIEATAAGCIVITDLPTDEVMPEIDGNLIRIDPNTSAEEIDNLVAHLCYHYDPDIQKKYSNLACQYYDYRSLGTKLADDIEELRRNYNA